MNKKVYLGILKENLKQSVQDLRLPEDKKTMILSIPSKL